MVLTNNTEWCYNGHKNKLYCKRRNAIMKRITILMMLLIALVMSSCGKESKEKVMESASEVDCQVFWRDISDNRALSDEKYMNKNLKRSKVK